jgi:hypothetical protein
MVNSHGGGGGSKALSGHKRKEYRPKVQGSSSVVDDPGLAIILIVDGTEVASIPTTTMDGGEDTVEKSDSNKKQKMVSPSTSIRSADQAEAAVQPCHMR